jgi:hypothetical protein
MKDVVVKKERKKRAKSKSTTYYVAPKDFLQDIEDFYKSGEISLRLAESINKIVEGLSYAPNFINYCISSDYEALTQRGWLKYNEINLEDKILSYELESQQLKWSKILNIYRNENYNDSIYNIKTNQQKILVTPGHKLLGIDNTLTSVENFNIDDRIITATNFIEYFIRNKKIKYFPDNIQIEKITIEKYKGVVWCPQTEYGTFVCRYGRYGYVTGNSYKEDMIGDARVKMVAALQHKKFNLKLGKNPFSYFTTIAFHAFINRIKKEKKHHQIVLDYQEQVYTDLLTSGEGTGTKNIYTDPSQHELED